MFCAALFWILMNVLLWRAEYGRQPSAGSAVPPSMIWRRILTAPDPSSLSIFHHGKKIGFCHWTTSVSEELSSLRVDAPAPPEGMVRRITGFRLQLEGNLTGLESPGRLRFDGTVNLSTNQSWQEFKVTVNYRPALLELSASATEQALHFTWDDGTGRIERVIAFSELQNPSSLLNVLSGLKPGTPLARELSSWQGAANGLTLPSLGGQSLSKSITFGPRWEGRNAELRLGHSLVRAYRLKARFLDKYEIRVFVSRVGEILRVDLPDENVLLNDQFAPSA